MPESEVVPPIELPSGLGEHADRPEPQGRQRRTVVGRVRADHEIVDGADHGQSMPEQSLAG